MSRLHLPIVSRWRPAIHRLAALPRTVVGLIVAGVVFSGITVAALAHEPQGGEPRSAAAPAGSGQTARGDLLKTPSRSATSALSGDVSAPPSEDSNLEGAVPVPAQSDLPSAERRLEAGGRFALPLKTWTTQTDRYGASRARACGLESGAGHAYVE